MYSSGLSQAGAWNYLREEITVALECRRPPRIGIGFDFDATAHYSDSMRSNIITHILARILNHCFQEPFEGKMQEDRKFSWQRLRKDLTSWKEQLPASFKPYSTARKGDNPFPSLWLVQPCHGKLLCKRLVFSQLIFEQWLHSNTIPLVRFFWPYLILLLQQIRTSSLSTP